MIASMASMDTGWRSGSRVSFGASSVGRVLMAFLDPATTRRLLAEGGLDHRRQTADETRVAAELHLEAQALALVQRHRARLGQRLAQPLARQVLLVAAMAGLVHRAHQAAEEAVAEPGGLAEPEAEEGSLSEPPAEAGGDVAEPPGASDDAVALPPGAEEDKPEAAAAAEAPADSAVTKLPRERPPRM